MVAEPQTLLMRPVTTPVPEVPPAAHTPAPAPAPHPAPRSGWQALEKLKCPVGHTITRRDSLLSGTLVARCECGRAWLVVAVADLLTTVHPASSLVYTIEITSAEAKWILAERPSLHQLLDRAGLLLGASR